MPTLGRNHPFIHQVNLNGLRPMLMKNLSKLVVPNLSLLWMDILSLSSSRMVWPMPPPLEDPQIRKWTHIHMSSSHLLMNGTPQSLTMILHTLMDWTPVKSLISTFLHHLMKRRVIGSVLPKTKVTVSPGGSSLRILKRSSFVLAFEVPSELQQTSVLHHLQGRGQASFSHSLSSTIYKFFAT